MELLFLLTILGAIVSLVAHSKGRNSFLWFLYGFFIWPVALIHVLVASRTAEEEEKRARKAADRAREAQIAAQMAAAEAEKKRARAEGRVICPHCAEFIKPSARICPHCHQSL